MPNYYPAMLDLRGRPAIVIGGDRVAAEKATNLQAAGARVTVINTSFCEELQELAQKQAVELRQKGYEYGDLAEAFVVIAATTYDPALTEQIWQEAQERGKLINIVDVPARCNFILPSILRRGQLTVSVSTEGSSPALAKRIRQQLEKVFPPAYATYLKIAGIARTYIKQYGLSYEERDLFFGAFFEAGILELLVAGNDNEAIATTVQLLQQRSVNITATKLIHDIQEVAEHHGSSQFGEHTNDRS